MEALVENIKFIIMTLPDDSEYSVYHKAHAYDEIAEQVIRYQRRKLEDKPVKDINT